MLSNTFSLEIEDKKYKKYLDKYPEVIQEQYKSKDYSEFDYPIWEFEDLEASFRPGDETYRELPNTAYFEEILDYGSITINGIKVKESNIDKDLLSHIEDYLIKELEMEANYFQDDNIAESWSVMRKKYQNFLQEDKLPGGKGDNKTLSDFDPKEVAIGLEVEREHTDDPEIVAEIVCDHLSEFPNYYTRLKSMEKRLEKEKEKKQ